GPAGDRGGQRDPGAAGSAHGAPHAGADFAPRLCLRAVLPGRVYAGARPAIVVASGGGEAHHWRIRERRMYAETDQLFRTAPANRAAGAAADAASHAAPLRRLYGAPQRLASLVRYFHVELRASGPVLLPAVAFPSLCIIVDGGVRLGG